MHGQRRLARLAVLGILLMVAASRVGWPLAVRGHPSGVQGASGSGGSSQGLPDVDAPEGLKGKSKAVFAWGRNNAGQLGLGHTRDVYHPEILSTFYPKEVKIVAANCGDGGLEDQSGFSMVVTTNGKLHSFGSNAYGQLGLGDNRDRNSMVLVELSRRERITKVSLGEAFALALTARGQVYTWGRNSQGQLGLGDVQDRSSPALVSSGIGTETIVEIAAGAQHAIALTSDGIIWTWGSNKHGQLGNGATGGILTLPAPIRGAVTGIKFSSVRAGSRHSLALTRSGEIYSWGANGQGQLGQGDTQDRNVPLAVLHQFTRARVTQIAAGAEHSMALSEKEEIFTFGGNRCHQLGYRVRGGREHVAYPRMLESIKGVKIRAGPRSSMAVARSGRVFVWGCNEKGQLGTGDTKARPQPTALRSGKGAYTAFGLGDTHTLALNAKADVVAWGENAHAQLGLGYESSMELEPKLVTSTQGSNILTLSTGGYAYEQQGHTVCRTDGGRVYAWGWNAFGQLGLGRVTKFDATPSRLFALEGAKAVAAFACGQYNTAALVESHGDECLPGLYTWGPNTSGQLGHKYLDIGPIPSPSRLESLKKTPFVDLQWGHNHAVALTTKGEVYVWGSNAYGQLGLGDSKDRSKPTLVNAFASQPVRAIGVGAFASFAVTKDNVTYAWGYNEGFELGIGEEYTRNAPQAVRALDGERIVAIACGPFHALAMTEEGVVFAWGDNTYGQLGLGHTDAVKEPRRVEGMPAVMAPGGRGRMPTLAAGNWHSVAISREGRIYVWGRNSVGQLGLGKKEFVVNAPQALSSLDGDYAVGVVAAASHTLALAYTQKTI